MTYLADTDPELELGPLQSAACTYRIALGPRAGQKVLSLQTVPTQAPSPPAVCRVSEQGFSLHAEVRCATHERHQLEHLCRYITRPTIANKRLTRNRAGQVVLTLKTPIEMARPTSSYRRLNSCNGSRRSSPDQGSVSFEASIP